MLRLLTLFVLVSSLSIGLNAQENLSISFENISAEKQKLIQDHLAEHLHCPESMNLSGNTYVYVGVIFDDIGEVNEIKLLRSPGPEFDKNAMKACEAMRTWNWKSEISEISESGLYQLNIILRFRCGEKVE